MRITIKGQVTIPQTIRDAAGFHPGTEVDFIWGEPDGGTTKPTVEKHRQTVIKGVVAPVPYSEVARTAYAPSWRNQA